MKKFTVTKDSEIGKPRIRLSKDDLEKANPKEGLTFKRSEIEEAIDEHREAILFEKAPPGEKYEKMIIKLKKQYPDDDSVPFAIAWAAYNKDHGLKPKTKSEEVANTTANVGTFDAPLSASTGEIQTMYHVAKS